MGTNGYVYRHLHRTSLTFYLPTVNLFSRPQFVVRPRLFKSIIILQILLSETYLNSFIGMTRKLIEKKIVLLGSRMFNFSTICGTTVEAPFVLFNCLFYNLEILHSLISFYTHLFNICTTHPSCCLECSKTEETSKSIGFPFA